MMSERAESLRAIEFIGQSRLPLFVDEVRVSEVSLAYDDEDGDGLPDPWELVHGLSGSTGDRDDDPDEDGLTNVEEWVLGTHPVVADTDEDGVNDGDEYLAGTDALSAALGDVAASSAHSGQVILSTYSCSETSAGFQVSLYGGGSERITSFNYVYASMFSPGFQELDSSYHWVWGGQGEVWLNTPTFVESGRLDIGVSTDQGNTYYGSFQFSCSCGCGCLDVWGVGSVDFQLALGTSGFGKFGQYLQVKELRWSDALYSRRSVRYAGPAESKGESVVPGEEGENAPKVLDWVRTDTQFTRLSDLPNGYLVEAFYLNQVDSDQQVTGEPFKRYRIENPDPLGLASRQRLRITEEIGRPAVREYRFRDTNGVEEWELFEGKVGSYLEQPVRYTRMVSTPSSFQDTARRFPTTVEWHEKGRFDEATGRLVIDEQTQRTYREFPFGRRLIEEVLDPHGEALRTRYGYLEDFEAFEPHENPGGFAQMQPQWEERPDGGWTWYGYDSMARRNRLVTPVGNTPRPRSLPGPGQGFRVVATEYTDDGLAHQVTVSVDGVVESVTTAELEPVVVGTVKETIKVIQGQAPARTTVKYRDVLTKRLLRQENPDGTVLMVDVSEDVDRRDEERFEGDEAARYGTRTVTSTHRSGLVLERRVIDVRSGVVTEHEKVLEYDAQFRALLTANEITGKVKAAGYDCCDLEWETGEDGSTRVSERDVLGRVVGLKNGFKDPLNPGNTLNMVTSVQRFQLDSLGRRLQTLDFGNGNATHPLVSSKVYNLARQMESAVFPDGSVSRQKTVLLPSGGRMELVSLSKSGVDQQYRITSRTFDAEGREIRNRLYAADSPFATTPARGTQVRHWVYEYGMDEMGRYEQLTDIASLFDQRVTRSYFDARDRRVAVIHGYGSANEARERFDYGAQDRLRRHIDADGMTTRYAYNEEGDREVVAIDLKREPGETMDHIDYAVDRITRTRTEIVEGKHGHRMKRQTTEVFTESGPVVLEVSERSLDGRRSSVVRNGRRTSRERFDGERPGTGTLVTTRPDASHTVAHFENGQVVRNVRHASDGTIISWTSPTYDTHGRVRSLTDSRTGTTTFHYDEKGRKWKASAPNPRTGSSAEGTLDTLYHYDALGQMIRMIKPGGGEVNHAYNANGTLGRVHGHHTTDVEYRYNGRGELTDLITRFGADDREARTRWAYDSRGRVAFKQDAAGKRVGYEYSPGGKLKARTWARGVRTDYHYDEENKVDLVAIDYSDRTPDVHLSYTRLGQKQTVQDAGGQTTYRYRAHAPFELLSETPTPDVFPVEKTLQYAVDGFGRSAGYSVGTNEAPAQDHRVGYGYDHAGRLESVHADGYWFTYAYVPNSTADLVRSVTAPFVKQTEFTYERGRDVVETVSNRVGFQLADEISRYHYRNDVDGRRTARTVLRGARDTVATVDEFRFDPDTGGIMASVRGDERDPHAFTYRYDKSGNRLAARAGVEEISYEVNRLHQYETVSGERLHYDADGNLTARGDRTFTWDAENRLTTIRERGSLVARYTYDHQSRRIARQTDKGVDERYLYQGWNLIAVYRPDEAEPLQTYTWGKDLSGTLQGAGGVGGLLFTKNHGDGNDAWIYHYDANGNVMEVTSARGKVLDRYNYDPFGNLLGKAALPENRWRFSTKPYDDESGGYYYGYRYYDPRDGRWLSRDPLEEHGGLNLYGFVGNDAIGGCRSLGASDDPGWRRCRIRWSGFQVQLRNRSHLGGGWYDCEHEECRGIARPVHQEEE